MSDTLRLELPNERRLFPAVRLVVGGLATLTDLSIDELEEFQLAVETVLTRAVPAGAHIVLCFEAHEKSVEATISPVAADVLADEDAGSPLTLERILSRLVEVAEIVSLDGEPSVRLERRLTEQPAEAIA